MGIDPVTHQPLPPPPPPPPEAAAAPDNDDKIDSNEVPLVENSDFCIDEIPVIEPHEILLPSDQSSPTPSTSSSCSSGGASSSDALLGRRFEDYCSEMMNSNIWEEEFGDVFDFLADFDGDLKVGENAVGFESSLPMIGDEDSWKDNLM